MKKILLFIMVAAYVGAGINHFIHPQPYIQIIPPFLPYPDMLVYVSGVFEIILGLLLIPRKTRRIAAWGIIILLIAVFPANVQMMINYRQENNPRLWIAVLRLPLQFLFIYWAYLYTRRRKPATAMAK